MKNEMVFTKSNSSKRNRQKKICEITKNKTVPGNPFTQMLLSDIKYIIIDFFIRKNECSNQCDYYN